MNTQLSLLEAEIPATPLLTENREHSDFSSAKGYAHQIYEVPSHGYKYFRYVVNCGHDVTESRSIPGGNTKNKLAQKRAALVQEYIDRGMTPPDILKLIDTWRKGES